MNKNKHKRNKKKRKVMNKNMKKNEKKKKLINNILLELLIKMDLILQRIIQMDDQQLDYANLFVMLERYYFYKNNFSTIFQQFFKRVFSKICLSIITHPLFEIISLIVIISNSVLLVFQDPSSDE